MPARLSRQTKTTRYGKCVRSGDSEVCLYLDAVKETEYLSDIKPVIHKARLAIGRLRPWKPIPV